LDGVGANFLALCPKHLNSSLYLLCTIASAYNCVLFPLSFQSLICLTGDKLNPREFNNASSTFSLLITSLISITFVWINLKSHQRLFSDSKLLFVYRGFPGAISAPLQHLLCNL
jgi:hypothetical protein